MPRSPPTSPSPPDGPRHCPRSPRCPGRASTAWWSAPASGPRHGRPNRSRGVNFFGALDVLDGLLPLLGAGEVPAAVVVSSNAASLTPAHQELLQLLLDGDEDKASACAAGLDGVDGLRHEQARPDPGHASARRGLGQGRGQAERGGPRTGGHAAAGGRSRGSRARTAHRGPARAHGAPGQRRPRSPPPSGSCSTPPTGTSTGRCSSSTGGATPCCGPTSSERCSGRRSACRRRRAGPGPACASDRRRLSVRRLARAAAEGAVGTRRRLHPQPLGQPGPEPLAAPAPGCASGTARPRLRRAPSVRAARGAGPAGAGPRDLDPTTSKDTSARVLALLACCPPGPPLVVKRHSSSSAGMTRLRVTRREPECSDAGVRGRARRQRGSRGCRRASMSIRTTSPARPANGVGRSWSRPRPGSPSR